MLELDFRAVKFLFFPRRDLNPHHCYTAAYIYTQMGRLVETFGIFYMGLGDIFIWAKKKSLRPKFQSHLITIYVCLIAYRKRLLVEGIVI